MTRKTQRHHRTPTPTPRIAHRTTGPAWLAYLPLVLLLTTTTVYATTWMPALAQITSIIVATTLAIIGFRRGAFPSLITAWALTIIHLTQTDPQHPTVLAAVNTILIIGSTIATQRWATPHPQQHWDTRSILTMWTPVLLATTSITIAVGIIMVAAPSMSHRAPLLGAVLFLGALAVGGAVVVRVTMRFTMSRTQPEHGSHD